MGFSILILLELFDLALYIISMVTLASAGGGTGDESINDEFARKEYGTTKQVLFYLMILLNFTLMLATGPDHCRS